MISDRVQVGVAYSDEQLQRLAAPAVKLADSALARERLKKELNAERERGDVRASTLVATHASYRDAKRRFREALHDYADAKKGL